MRIDSDKIRNSLESSSEFYTADNKYRFSAVANGMHLTGDDTVVVMVVLCPRKEEIFSCKKFLHSRIVRIVLKGSSLSFTINGARVKFYDSRRVEQRGWTERTSNGWMDNAMPAVTNI